MPTTDPLEQPLPDIIGTGSAMRAVARHTRLVAPHKTNVLIIGETGTGKELIARAIHRLSKRSDGPYVRVNCGALNENLLESELFGHVKGAFTDARDNKTGRFEAAHGGSIFLDEISSMSFRLQVKLLRVLQESEFERVGESRTIKVDVRFIAATNQALEDEIAAGRFREDLYYRLHVMPIMLPPLRERRDDIPLLAKHFLRRYGEVHKLTVPELPEVVNRLMMQHDWPGNVRELENYIERLVIESQAGPLTAESVPPPGRSARLARSVGRPTGRPDDVPALIKHLVRVGMQTLPQKKWNELLVDALERELIEQAVAQFKGNNSTAAEAIGINRNTLHKKINQYSVKEPPPSPPTSSAPTPPPPEEAGQ